MYRIGDARIIRNCRRFGVSLVSRSNQQLQVLAVRQPIGGDGASYGLLLSVVVASGSFAVADTAAAADDDDDDARIIGGCRIG